MRRLSVFTTLFCLALPSAALAQDPELKVLPRVKYKGSQQMTFRYGPIAVAPGQNTVEFSPMGIGPKRAGFITRFRPDLVLADSLKPTPGGTIHLHHAHWKVDGEPTFPAGEEKTIVQFPRGFGLQLKGGEPWRANYMIHNLTNKPARVYLTWQLDYLPERFAANMRPVDIYWLDVVGFDLIPVFTAARGSGSNGRYVFPDQASPREKARLPGTNRWKLDRDLTLVGTFSHMHPGSLYSTLSVRRGNQVRTLFRSRSKYFNPRSPASWDMAITATRPDWRIRLRAGDQLYLNTTMDTSKHTWRDSMGNLPLLTYSGTDAGGVDPFAPGASWPVNGRITHGRLASNQGDAGGLPSDLPDPRSLPDGPQVSSPIPIKSFRFQLGNLADRGPTALPPVISRGSRLSFVNLDYPRYPSMGGFSASHTITACRAPCNASTGLSYPVEDASRSFDSGQLGYGTTPPVTGTVKWSTPASLTPGTYTYFCRIHPFMRGAFRVKDINNPADLSVGWSSLPSGGNR